MSTVDSKVVEMKFDNKGFSEGVKNTIQGLNNLSGALAKTAGNVALDGLGKAADKVSNRFSLMRIAAVTAVATIASQATRGAETFIKGFTLDPITAGFKNYETQINAVQTILANTGLEGKKGLGQVNDVLAELNTYANQTVYNFSDMTKNIGTFTAAGVALKPAASAIKGIANLAALSGSSSDQASTAMYQLSQAIAANKVGLQDWNSVVNAGLGGKVFQRALFQTGATMGTIKGLKVGETFDQWTKAGNSFRGSLQKGWITGAVLTKTLSQFTGDMKDADLAAQGFSKTQIAAIQKQAAVARGAATNIKTITQLKDALKEEVGTAYATIFKTLLGDINQATNLLSVLHVAVENALTGPIYKLNKLLEGWAKLGGRVKFIDAMKYAFKDLMSIVKPIEQAFHDIFPATTSKRLYELTVRLEKFFQYFKLGVGSAKNLRHTFEGLFAALDIGKTIIEAVARFIVHLFKAIADGTSKGGFLAITGHIGLLVVKLDKALKSGKGLNEFFDNLLKFIQPAIDKLHELEAYIAGLFGGGKKNVNANGILAQFGPLQKLAQNIRGWFKEIPHIFDDVSKSVKDFFSRFNGAAGPTADKVGKLGQAFSKIGDLFKKIDWDHVGSSLAKIAGAVGNALLKAGTAAIQGLGSLFSNIDYKSLLSTVNVGLLGGLVLLVKKFLGDAGGTFKAGTGFIKAIKEPFEGLTGVLGEMQKTLKATILLEIATSIGILALACTALAKISPSALTSSLQAIGALMAELFATLFGFSRIGGVAGIVATASSMVIFSAAIEVFANVVKKLAAMKIEQLNQGLTGLSKLLAAVVLAAIAMGKYSAPMIAGATGMLILSGAIEVLTHVVKELGKADPKVLAQGFKTVAQLLAALALFSKFSEADKFGVLTGAGILIMALAIQKLVKPIKQLGSLPIDTLRKGLITVGSIMAGFGILSKIEGNPATILASAASMIIIGYALKQLIGPMQDLGKMSWESLAKGLTVMVIAIGGIATALSLMPLKTVVTAGAIALVAEALTMIGTVVQNLGSMSWEDLAKGLVAMGGALLIIGVAVQFMQSALLGATTLVIVAHALSILAPVLENLGKLSWGQVAVALVALAGALAVIGVAAALLTPVIPSLLALGASIALLGVGVAGIGAGIFLLATGLAAIAAVGAGAAATIAAIVGAVIVLIPLFATKLVEGIGNFVTALQKTMPKILSFIKATLLQVINVVASVTPPLIKTVIKLIGDILNQLSKHAPTFFKQMVNLLLQLLNAVKAKAPAIINSVLSIVQSILTGLAKHVGGFVKAGADIIVNIIKGLTKEIPRIVTAAVQFIVAFVKALAANAILLVNAALDMVVTIVNGLADAIRTHTQPLIDAGMNLAGAIIDGIVKGISELGSKALDAIGGLASGLKNKAFKVLGINSPSKEFIKIGRYVGDGFAIGITQGTPGVIAAFQQASDILKKATDDARTNILDYQDKLKNADQSYKDSGDKVKYYTQKIAEASKNHKTTASTLTKLNQELEKAKKAHADAAGQIDKYTKLLELANKDHVIAKAALADLTNHYKKQHAELLTLGKTYDGYLAQLDKEKQKLIDLKTVRDDYIKSIQDQYNVLPDINVDTTASSYSTTLTEQLNNLSKFADVLQQLRSIGLDDQTYKLLLQKGPDALPFMEELLQNTQNGTGTTVSNITALDSQLKQMTDALGVQAGTDLYQAGVDTQQKIVDGIQSKADATKAAMAVIAKQIVDGLNEALGNQAGNINAAGGAIGVGILNGLRNALGIHSPSKEMALLGGFAVDGIVLGLTSSAQSVTDAAANLGTSAKEALKQAISGLSDDFGGITNLNPTITPVLDLSEVQKTAGGLDGMLTPNSVGIGSTFQKAQSVSAAQLAILQQAKDAANPATQPGGDTLNYTQILQSPKALSAGEIYRQTRNQLSVTKGALTSLATPVS